MKKSMKKITFFVIMSFIACVLSAFVTLNTAVAGMPESGFDKDKSDAKAEMKVEAKQEKIEGGDNDMMMPPPPPPDGPGRGDGIGGPGHGGPGGPGDMMSPRSIGKEHKDFFKKLTKQQREELKKIMMLGKSYNDLATIYVEQGKIDEAVATLKKVLVLEEPSYFPSEFAKEKKIAVSMRIIEVYLKGGREAEAQAEAEALSKSQLDAEKQAYLYSIMGNIYQKKGDKSKAADMIKKSIEILEKDVKKK